MDATYFETMQALLVVGILIVGFAFWNFLGRYSQ